MQKRESRGMNSAKIDYRNGLLTTVVLAFLVGASGLRAGQVSLSWQLPTVNMDGTPVTDLAGCKVYYGPSTRNYSQVIDLPGSVTNCVVTGLQENVTYYFAGTCYNTIGNESDFSQEVAKTPPDTTPPSIIRPPDVALTTEADNKASVPDLTVTVAVSDNRSLPANIAVAQSPAGGSRVGPGNTVVTLTATDEAGNSSTCTVNVVVTARTVSVPEPAKNMRVVAL
jgi:hypothetical protein